VNLKNFEERIEKLAEIDRGENLWTCRATIGLDDQTQSINQSDNHQTLWEEPSFVRHTQSEENKTFFSLSRHQTICMQQVKPSYENPRCSSVTPDFLKKTKC
jgi:hypothetical protein